MVPLWTSKDSTGESILTMTPAGKAKPWEPRSIIDLSISNGLKKIFLVETGMTGFMSALNNCDAAKLDLCFGIKFKICSDVNDKSPESRNTESNVIVFLKNYRKYQNFIHLWNRAAVDNFYWYPRIDSNLLKELWDEDSLMLAFPFYSSFLARNYLELNECIVDFSFTKPIFFIENSQLPFDDIIFKHTVAFAQDNNLEVFPARSIYYEKYSDLEAFQIMRCIRKKTSLDKPNLDHFSSNRFCFEDYLKYIKHDKTI